MHPDDLAYFDSYSHFHIHEEMLRDSVRTLCYREAIELNPKAFHGKSVLDIGCGTGVLSIFAARAGAARVVGVEMAQIAHYARAICEDYP